MPLVLLADASPDSAQVCEQWLLGAGFTVSVASSGPDALSKINTSTPDLVVADAALPGMEPFALAEALRAHEATSLVPVVVLVATIQPDLLNRAAAVGIDSLVLKPCDAASLVAEVNAVLAACARVVVSTRQPERRNVRRRHADVLRARMGPTFPAGM